MFSQSSGVSIPPPSQSPEIDTPDTWGSLRRFMRLTGVDEVDGYYWMITVHRPAHRVGHPRLNIDGCPGCLFEQVVTS